MRGPITGRWTRPLLGVGGGGRLVEVLVGGEAAGVAGEGEAAEGVTGYCGNVVQIYTTLILH